MAAHDDQISNNRRKLFTALSAAPVVMTLRPGTAAASSAYQCLTKIRDGLVLDPGPVNPGGGDPFLYQILSYWVLRTSSRVQSGGGNSTPVKLDGTGITDTELESGLTVVSMDPETPSAGPFFLLPLDPTATPTTLNSRFSNDPDVEMKVSGVTLQITNDQGKLCLSESGIMTGGFAVVVYTGQDGTGLTGAGTHPQASVVVSSASPGDNQGITHSCLCSVYPGNPVCTITNG